MEKIHNIFEDDDLDRDVSAADDTGMVSNEQAIVQEEILEHTEGDEAPADDVP